MTDLALLSISYTEGIKGYKVFDPGTCRVTHVASAIFDETSVLSGIRSKNTNQSTHHLLFEGDNSVSVWSVDDDEAPLAFVPEIQHHMPATPEPSLVIIDSSSDEVLHEPQSADSLDMLQSQPESSAAPLRRSSRHHTASPLDWQEVPLFMQGLESLPSAYYSSSGPDPTSEVLAQVYLAAQDIGEPERPYKKPSALQTKTNGRKPFKLNMMLLFAIILGG